MVKIIFPFLVILVLTFIEVYYTDVVYEINEYEGELKPDAESRELVWVPIDKLPDNIMPTQIEYIEKFVNALK